MARTSKARKGAKPSDKKPEAGVYEIPGQVSLERSPFKLRGRVEYLSTDIDRLYSYILEKRSAKLSEAAAKFKVKKELVEEWGSILEDHHMIEMHYPVAGEPTLRIPSLGKGKVKEAKKKGSKKRRKPLHAKLTRKRLLIMAEIIVLGEILIYVFLVNPHLRDNFMPTLNYQLANLPANIMNLPGHISNIPAYLTNLFGQLPGSMPINPLYLVIGILIAIFWMAAALIRRRKKGSGKAK